jgi:hypothetical protein
LPADILLYIIDFIVPATIHSPIALCHRNTITKTILSLTLTSRIIYPTARRLLYTHCLYINTPRRLHGLLKTLSDPSDPSKPFRNNEHLLPYITSLYLRPFASYTTIKDLSIATAVRNLLFILSPHLRRVLIDMPLRSYYPEDDALGIRPILRSAFADLPALEEFCSVRDELYLDTLVAPSEEWLVWSLWPKLRTIALYNVDVLNHRFWEGLRQLENIETVVLTRSDGLEEVDIKREWRKQFDEATEARSLSIVLVNVEAEHKVLVGRDSWKEDDKMQVRELNVPTSYYGDEDPIVLCQQWTKRNVLHGEPVAYWI